MKERKFWSEELGISNLKENEVIKIRSREYLYKNRILRERNIYSGNQSQKKNAFAFKWNQRDSYDSKASDNCRRKWLVERYLGGDKELLKKWLTKGTKLLDAGCGAGSSALLLFGKQLKNINYLGVDISDAVDVAMGMFKRRDLSGEFLQADLMHLPFSGPVFDVIFSEGVLHHTDCPEKTFKALAKLIKPRGRFIFYVYRKKAPIREFVDDYIRNYLKDLDDRSAWEQLIPLTKLGKILGDLKITINVPQSIPSLGIPSGKIDLQRLFYWYIAKVFYRYDFNLKEMNHVNFDWYRPVNCHRHTSDEVRKWCIDSGFNIDKLSEEESGITVVARKK